MYFLKEKITHLLWCKCVMGLGFRAHFVEVQKSWRNSQNEFTQKGLPSPVILQKKFTFKTKK
jgi:hypothetical protein